MKHKLLYSAAVLLSGFVLGACGSDGDDATTGSGATPAAEQTDSTAHEPLPYTVETVTGEPAWQISWQYNQPQPDWAMPEASDYEYWTVIIVQLEDVLYQTAAATDLMAVLIDGEVCGLAYPSIAIGPEEDEEGPTEYLIKVYSNKAADDAQSITLQYYSTQLQQVFTSYEQVSFGMYDETPRLTPQFTLGAEKYPVRTTYGINLTTTDASGVVPAAGDRIAAFVADECRGTCTLDDDLLLSETLYLQVLGQQTDEVVTLKYYHAATQRVFTFTKTVRMDDDMQTISLSL